MPLTKSHLASLAVASVALVGGGVAAANAAGGAESTTPSSSASAPATAGQQPGSPDTPVTGAAKTKVVDAVEQAHDGVSITDVRQDPDGSYDALGTDADGNPVFYDVSKDLATITEHTGPGGHGGPGGPGGSPDTPVTGAAKTKVVDAVEQAHDGVTVTDVRQDPDGSYDALGTDADGNPVFYDVSKDLATITEHTGPGGAPAPGSADASS